MKRDIYVILRPTDLIFKNIFEELETMGLTLLPDGNRIAHKFSPNAGTDNGRISELLHFLQHHRKAALNFLERAQ